MNAETKQDLKRWSILPLSALVMAVLIGLMFVGCASTKPLQKALDEAYASGRAETCGPVEDALAQASEDLDAMRERLRRFNQVDAEGSLLPLKDQARAALLAEVGFQTDSAELTASAIQVLDKVVDYIVSNPSPTLRLDGFADPRGPDLYNLDLGQRRADAVMRYLVEKGIDADRVWSTSLGEVQQTCWDPTPDCWELNRRVAVEIEGPEK